MKKNVVKGPSFNWEENLNLIAHSRWSGAHRTFALAANVLLCGVFLLADSFCLIKLTVKANIASLK